MIGAAVVRRYAAALLEQAWTEGAVDLVESDLGLVGLVLESSPDLKEVLFNPLLPAARKHEIVRLIFEGKIHDLTFSYLNLLIDKRREEAILTTEREFVRLAEERRGVAHAEAVSAVPLARDEVAELKERLAALTGKTVELTTDVDPDLIGGVLVRIGDRVMDGTVKGYLERIREEMIGRAAISG